DMGIDRFVQNKLSFTRADGTSGDAYEVALARHLINSDGLYAGDYQAEWGGRDDDAELGRILNDPVEDAAKLKKAKQVLGDDVAVGLFGDSKKGGSKAANAQAQLDLAAPKGSYDDL